MSKASYLWNHKTFHSSQIPQGSGTIHKWLWLKLQLSFLGIPIFQMPISPPPPLQIFSSPLMHIPSASLQNDEVGHISEEHKNQFAHNLGESCGSDGLAEPAYIPLWKQTNDHDLVLVAVVLGKVANFAACHYDIHATFFNGLDLLDRERETVEKSDGIMTFTSDSETALVCWRERKAWLKQTVFSNISFSVITCWHTCLIFSRKPHHKPWSAYVLYLQW